MARVVFTDIFSDENTGDGTCNKAFSAGWNSELVLSLLFLQIKINLGNKDSGLRTGG